MGEANVHDPLVTHPWRRAAGFGPGGELTVFQAGNGIARGGDLWGRGCTTSFKIEMMNPQHLF